MPRRPREIMSGFDKVPVDLGVPAASFRAPATSRRMYIESFGCQMNVYDTQRMADTLAADGYTGTAELEEADLVLLNPCHIREHASEKVYSELGKLRALKTLRAAHGKETRIVVAGCVAQAEGAEIFRRQHAVDAVVGPQSYHRLPGILRQLKTEAHVADTEFPVESKFDFLVAPQAEA